MATTSQDYRDAQEKTVLLHGLEYAYKEWGSSDNPIILAWHGWLDNANTFDMLAPVLAQSYQVISFDIMGHGLSSHLPEGRFYHYVDMLADVVALTQLWAEEKPIIALGHSLGGALATTLAALRPEWVSACVTIDALGPLVSPVSECLENLSRAFENRSQWHTKSPRVMSSLAQAVSARFSGGAWPITKPAAERLCLRGTRQVKNGFIWATDPRLMSPSPMRLCEEQVSVLLRKITCPLMVVLADQGLLCQMPELEQRRQQVSLLKERMFSGGHHVHMEDDAVTIGEWILCELDSFACDL